VYLLCTRTLLQNFSIGFGPKLLSFKSGRGVRIGGKDDDDSSSSTAASMPVDEHVEYALRLIPVGGFVSFPVNFEEDEEGVITEDDHPDLLQVLSITLGYRTLSTGSTARSAVAFMFSRLALSIDCSQCSESFGIYFVVESSDAASCNCMQLVCAALLLLCQLMLVCALFIKLVRTYIHHTHTLQNRSVLQRALVVSAGVLANLALTWACLFASVSSNGVVRATYEPGVVLSSVTDARGPAAIAGLQVLHTSLLSTVSLHILRSCSYCVHHITSHMQ
jgi:membrane-associated protease RseP (regulator of RpoE activity)